MDFIDFYFISLYFFTKPEVIKVKLHNCEFINMMPENQISEILKKI